MWLVPTGREMSDAEWTAEHVRCLGVRLAGGAIGERDESGQPIVGDTLLYLLNADDAPIDFTLPTYEPGLTWQCLVDTFDAQREAKPFTAGGAFQLGARSAALFQGVRG
jgi:glycogen operon protein